MAKLYAELTSDKGGRIVGKAGNKIITIELTRGNYKIGRVILTDSEVKTEVYKDIKTA